MQKISLRPLLMLLVAAALLAALTFAAMASGAPETITLDIDDGSITVGSGTAIQGDDSWKIPAGGLVITGTSSENNVVVDPGEEASVAFTIEELSISSDSGASLIDVRSGSAVITLSAQNTLTGAGNGALIRVSEGQALTITGSGSLALNNGSKGRAAHGAAIGGSAAENGGVINIESGNITITQYGPGAGIGGGGPDSTFCTGDSGIINISGGTVDITVTAVDNYGGGCGIGPGMNYHTTPSLLQDGVLNSITISGGTVNCKNNSTLGYSGSVYYSGAAIGTGRIGSQTENEGKIHITGTADVTASADVSAAIGGSAADVTSSYLEPGGNVTILIDGNSKVSACTVPRTQDAYYIVFYRGVYNGAAIGQAYIAWLSYDIDIEGNAQVSAEGGYYGAGVGDSLGYTKNAGIDISISGSARVEASSAQYAAGIGSSFSIRSTTNSRTDITIGGSADVIAVGGYSAAGIGGGYGNNAGDITITGSATVIAAGGASTTYEAGGAGIGAGCAYRLDPTYGGKVLGTITINPGTDVIAYAEGNKFAIDLDTNGQGSVNVADTVLNGRFAEGVDPPVNSDGESSPINLLKDDALDSGLMVPDDYRSFAVTASDGKGVIKVQNEENKTQYAYFVDESGAKQIVYPLYDSKTDDRAYTMLTKDNLRWMSLVSIVPADITVYVGGNGYEGAVDVDGEPLGKDNGFPVPGFTISAEGLDRFDPTNAFLTYRNGDISYSWDIVPYDGVQGASHGIYRFEPRSGRNTHVKISFFDEDLNKYVDSDSFDIEDSLGKDLKMEVYGESIEMGYVKLVYGDAEYAVTSGNGTLKVRSTTESEDYGSVVERERDVPRGEPGVVAHAGTTYYINNKPVEVVDARGVKLLFDDIVEDNSADVTNTQLLINRADSELGGASATRRYEAKYLDLVDTSNGNAWVAADKDITVYWPLPAGTGWNTNFTLLRFDGLNRETSVGNVENLIATCNVTPIRVENTGTHIKFTVEKAGFAPFILVWDEYNTPITPIPEPDNSPVGLNTEDHVAYIIGYEDGTVRPGANITRAEVATIFFRLLTDETRESYWSQSSGFTDVASGAWYNNAVSTLTRAGILDGYEDGSFRPNASITRAEFTKIAVSFFKHVGGASSNPFNDVPDSAWYAEFVKAAAELGLIDGYEDGTFRPNAPITRAEACTIVNRTLGRAPDKDNLLPEHEMLTWPDNSRDAWYYAQLQEATNSHDYQWLGAIELWTAKLAERDWDALEKEWSNAYSAPGGEVAR